tara:strand:+ start:219 stop:1127 length:909 start_codon:yes stop_codon:yes gene_type:complete
MENSILKDDNPVIQEIEDEIEDTKKKQNGELEIEIVDEEQPKEEYETKNKKEKDKKYSIDVQRRIKRLIAQKKDAEDEVANLKSKNDSIMLRLERLEKGSQNQEQNKLNEHYHLTKKALAKAIEEGDTEKQVQFNEQLVDMKTAMQLQNLQKTMKPVSPTVDKAKEISNNPAPQKAMQWYQNNNWFNSKGFERESAMARSIDVQLDIEGFDKNSDEYYDMLNNRLQRVYPELVSTTNDNVTTNKPRQKSREPVSPTAGGSTYRGNRVKMTQDELRMARELGITDEASLKRYQSELTRIKKGV